MTCHVQIYNWVPPLKPIMKPKIPGEKDMDCYDMFAHSENCWTLGSDDVWMRIWYSEKNNNSHFEFLEGFVFLTSEGFQICFLNLWRCLLKILKLRKTSEGFEVSESFRERFWNFGKLQTRGFWSFEKLYLLFLVAPKVSNKDFEVPESFKWRVWSPGRPDMNIFKRQIASNEALSDSEALKGGVNFFFFPPPPSWGNVVYLYGILLIFFGISGVLWESLGISRDL